MTDKPETGYFLVTGEVQKAAWDEYRRQYIAWRRAISEYVLSLGAKKYRSWHGAVSSIDMGRLPAPAGWRKNNRGITVIMKRGRSHNEKEGIAAANKRNEELAAILPSADKLAASHGFIGTLGYRSEDGQSIGSRVIGRMFGDMATWHDESGEIVLISADAAAAIENTTAEGWITDLASWSVPEGYRQMSLAEYTYREAKHTFDQEEMAKNAQG